LFGIKCDQAIHCSYLIVTSDERIKENIKDIEDDVSLKQLRLLKPKTYKYKDKLDKGNREVIGFIAQEVREVLPNAVKLDQRAIPNILKPCCAYNESQDILELRLDSPMANDITGKTIQIYVNDVSYIVKVILCEGQLIHIKKPDEMADFDGKNPCVADGDRALVYGEYVDDFHLLDKSEELSNNKSEKKLLLNQLLLNQRRRLIRTGQHKRRRKRKRRFENPARAEQLNLQKTEGLRNSRLVAASQK